MVGGGPIEVEDVGPLSELIRLILPRDFPRFNTTGRNAPVAQLGPRAWRLCGVGHLALRSSRASHQVPQPSGDTGQLGVGVSPARAVDPHHRQREPAPAPPPQTGRPASPAWAGGPERRVKRLGRTADLHGDAAAAPNANSRIRRNAMKSMEVSQ